MRENERVTHVLRQWAITPRGIGGVQLGVGEDPEDDREDAGDGLGSDEVGSVAFDFSSLSKLCRTFLLKSLNWGMREMVSRYCEKAQAKSARKFLLRLGWNSSANTKAMIIR